MCLICFKSSCNIRGTLRIVYFSYIVLHFVQVVQVRCACQKLYYDIHAMTPIKKT